MNYPINGDSKEVHNEKDIDNWSEWVGGFLAG